MSGAASRDAYMVSASVNKAERTSSTRSSSVYGCTAMSVLPRGGSSASASRLALFALPLLLQPLFGSHSALPDLLLQLVGEIRQPLCELCHDAREMITAADRHTALPYL